MSSTPTARIFEPRWGQRQINRRAWDCLDRCRKKLTLSEIPLPVPVEQWIEGPLRIRFGVTDLSHLGENVLGAAFVQEREILIDEQVLAHEGRCRFTCAHELGHLMLHAKLASEFHDTLDLGMDSPNDYEREADRFAAAFLMPLPLLEREFLRIIDQHHLDRARCTVALMKTSAESESLWRTRFLPAITRRFGVSLSAAIIRFNNIQPRLPAPRPLLPYDLTKPLLQPARQTGGNGSIHQGHNVHQQRNLFAIHNEESADQA